MECQLRRFSETFDLLKMLWGVTVSILESVDIFLIVLFHTQVQFKHISNLLSSCLNFSCISPVPEGNITQYDSAMVCVPDD